MSDEQFLRDVPVLTSRTRITLNKRAAYRFAASRAYRRGKCGIAAIAQHSRRSPFFVRTMLIEAKVVFRPPGRPVVRAGLLVRSDSPIPPRCPWNLCPRRSGRLWAKAASHSPC